MDGKFYAMRGASAEEIVKHAGKKYDAQLIEGFN